MPTMETQCTRCIHREVCSFKNDFLKAQESVHKTVVSLHDCTEINLCDIPFIYLVELQCKYYCASIESGTRPSDYSRCRKALDF